jgi:iron-sulfur cluster repair protein YtfE (RIC family)
MQIRSFYNRKKPSNIRSRAWSTSTKAPGGRSRKCAILTLDYYIPDEACNTYRALFAALIELEGDLHQHIHLENNMLFPRAAALPAR